MTELKIKAVVVGSKEEKNAEFAESCFKKARGMRACFFKIKHDRGPALAYFNFSQDRVQIDNYLLSTFAYSGSIEGNSLAKEWEKEGWQKLGPRVSWRRTSRAIEFALASGHHYQLRRTELRDWYEGKGFPILKETK